MVQTRATQYASGRDAPPWAAPLVPAERLVLRVMASLEWSSFRPRLRRISAGLIQAVSPEQLVLSATAAELA